VTGPVAIVGIGCRFPRANGPKAYWRALLEGVDAVGEVPPSRYDPDELAEADEDAPENVNPRWGGFLDDVEGFDANFFGISAREATRMDPQQRLALEVAWEALEDAGLPAGALAGTTAGVFMGVSTYDHGAALDDTPERDAYDGTGAAFSIVANRLSYVLDTRGPSVAVDTACSSSLVALHLACRALGAGDAEVALAGGVNVITSPTIGLSYSESGLLSPDGRCKPFDHRANGIVRSEGAGVVVLKPLERALADGDRVYAVVAGSAVNHDGRTNGLTAPNRFAQESLLQSAYRNASIDPSEVDYVEAHGTGTAVGDPIEAGALATVLCAERSPERPLRIGSVKSNIGHPEAAAGVAGVIKTALALHHRELPPTVHFESPNPLLGLDRAPLTVQSERTPWPERGGTPIAGVSSFGFGGTNAHAVLTAAPVREQTAAPDRAGEPRLIPVSARSEGALAQRVASWGRAASEHAGEPAWFARAAAAAGLRTEHHGHRAALVAASAEELSIGAAALAGQKPAPGTSGPRPPRRRRPRTVFVFPGNGAEAHGVGARLARSNATFRETIRAADAAVARHLGRSLWDEEAGLFADGTATLQPAVFSMQVALAAMWREWGIEPSAVVGHSLGEVAAAHVAGALTLDEAALVVCERARLLDEISGAGGLIFTELDQQAASEFVHGHDDRCVAAVNGPRATVLAGPHAALDEMLESLTADGVFARRVLIDYAAHSPAVEPLQPRLRAALEGRIEPREAEIPMYSTVTGEPVTGTGLDPAYWDSNLRAKVLFSRAIDGLLGRRHDLFVELSSHPILARSIAETGEAGGHEPATVASMRRGEDELRATLHALGELYTLGADVDWRALEPAGAPHVELPPHPWEHRRFPTAAQLVAANGGRRARRSARDGGDGGDERELLGQRIRVGADPALRLWPLPLDLTTAPELADHVVDEVPLIPAAYWMTAAAEAASDTVMTEAVVLEDVSFSQPCPASAEGDPGLQLAVRPTREGDLCFTITSAPAGGPPVTHADGSLRASVPGDAPSPDPPAEILRRCSRSLSVGDQYGRLEGAGLSYGSRFQGLVELHAGPNEALGRIRLPAGLRPAAAPLHAALLDACLHTVATAAGAAPEGALPLPAGVGRVWAQREGSPLREGWSHARLLEVRDDEVIADVEVLSDAGVLRWAAKRFRVRLVRPRRSPTQPQLYDLHWDPVEPPPATAAPGTWLMLPDEAGVAPELARLLEAGGDRVIGAVIGLDAGTDDGALDADADEHDALLAEASAEGNLRGVIDARALAHGAHDLGEDPPDVVAGRVLRLTQAIARASWPDGPPRLWLLTAATQAAGAAAHAPGLPGATLWGLGRTATNELPDLPCSLADLDWPPAAPQIEALARTLRSPEPPSQLALRGDRLLAPSLAPVTGLTTEAEFRAREDRSYLITGGLGALGLHVASWLAERGAGALVLLGRSAPGPDAERAIERLRESGVRVDVEQADVADRDQLAAVLAAEGSGRPPLGGVVHAAGVIEDALITDVSPETLRRTLAGKATGAWNLHLLTQDHPVELFVMFASVAGVAGSPGQAAYAAANTFLDALATYRAAVELPALSLDWGPWAGEGMAAGLGAERAGARGVPPLEPSVALDLLEQALGRGRAQLTAAAFDAEELERAALGPAARELLAGIAPGLGAVSSVVRDEIVALASPVERKRAVRRFVVEQIAQILAVPNGEVDTRAPFQNLGFDSLMAVELRNRLERSLSMRLSTTVMFAYPTAEALADGLLERLEADAPAEAPAAAPPPQVPPKDPEPVREPAPPVYAGADGGAGAADEDMSDLGEDELAAMLADELAALEGAEER
jgi:myxalamid-type polyketide synthase MxaE and MxaD